MALQLVHHPDYDAGFPAGHRFPMDKYRLLMEGLTERGLVVESNMHLADPAPGHLLSLAHDADYVAQVIACSVPRHVERDIGFEVSARVSWRAQLAVGGTFLTAQLALRHGIACNTAGGSHHARRAQGAGFCTFNDVAVAALALLAQQPDANILVVDLDVHQGDGTADILGGEPRVFTCSMHGENNYPPRKIASDLDIALADGTGDDAYLETLEDVLPSLSARKRWDLVFYNAGVDPHAEDRLGRLSLSDEGLRRRDLAVIRHFRERDICSAGSSAVAIRRMCRHLRADTPSCSRWPPPSVKAQRR